MFATAELNAITELLKGHRLSETALKHVYHQYVNLEAALLRGKILREFSKLNSIYICQPKIHSQQSSFAYIFAPFILANLNHKAIYHTQASVAILDFLNKYYQADYRQKLRIDDVLDHIKLYIQLDHENLTEVDFIYLSIIQALCRPDVSQIFIITDLSLDQEKIDIVSEYLQVSIQIIFDQKHNMICKTDAIDSQKLFFKKKDQDYINLCHDFSILNAEIIQNCTSFTNDQTIHLIEDMFYSEQIFEKLSVYAEFIQTKIQNQSTLS